MNYSVYPVVRTAEKEFIFESNNQYGTNRVIKMVSYIPILMEAIKLGEPIIISL
jgi:hypothetical protein